MNISFLSLWERSPHPNLGILYLSSYLKKYSNGHKINYLDQEKFSIEQLKKTHPDVVGLTAVTPSFQNICSAAKKIKEELDVPIIIGGPHITSLPKTLPKYIDVGIIGEGEETFRQLVDDNLENLQNIQGIVYGKDKKITQRRPLIDPIDKIPPPDRALLDPDRYFVPHDILTIHEKIIGTNLITSRGCPYACLTGEALITLADGSKMRIDEFVHNPKPVLSHKDGKIVTSQIEATQIFEKDELIEMEAEDGTTLKLTPDHEVYTKRGWIRADNLTEEDYILKQ